MRVLRMPPVMQRQSRLLNLAMALSLCSGLAQAAPEADPSLKDIPMPAVAAPATCPAKATVPGKNEMQAMVRDAQDRGLLWRVSHDGRDSWLYGTSHVGRREWLMPGRTVMGAMMKSDKLALELNVLDPEVSKSLAQGMKARDDAPELSAALAARLELQREKACAQDIAPLRPDAQVVALQALAGRPLGVYPDYGVDMMLAGMAAGLKKPVVGLETPELQIRELFSDDPAQVSESVSEGLKQLESGKAPEMVNLIADLWADGRQDRLENYADWCDCANTPHERAQLQRLIDGRNPGMADGIVNLLKEGDTVFAAVGALHMVGPHGLPVLLRKKGYKVERVPLNALKKKQGVTQ